MRINSVFVVALMIFGCQGSKGTTDDAPPNDVEGATENATEEEATPEPEVAAEDPVDEAEAKMVALMDRVRGLLQVKRVSRNETGVWVGYILEQSPTVDENSKPKAVTDAMMFATFYAMPLLYNSLADLDGLDQSFEYKGKQIGSIKTTRESFEALNYAEATQGVTDPEARQAVYRKLLKQLPKGAVTIDKKYRPR